MCDILMGELLFIQWVILSETGNHSSIYYKDEAPKDISYGRYLYVEVVIMIERLMNPERPYGEPEYSKLSEQIARLKQELNIQLDQEGTKRLERLSDIYIRQETVILRDAFADGFWSAIELMLEFDRRRLNHK